MSGWSPFSGITYPQYQQGASYVRDITDAITVSNKSLQKSLAKNVSSFTTQVVASQQALTRDFQNSYDQLNNTLSWGLNRLSDNLQDINWAIEDFHSDFTYSMGLLLVEMQSQNKILKNIADKLDEINETLKHPLLTQAREYYSMGEERLKKKLIGKALDSFLKASELNDADFFVEYQLGNIYLFGADDDENLIDLDKSKEHLLAAAKYAKAEMKFSTLFTKITAETYLKASFSVYFKLNAELLTSDPEASELLLTEARDLATQAFQIDNDLLEAWYHICKYDALLGNKKESLSLLNKLINRDPNYSIKAIIDEAFNPIRPDLEILLVEKKEIKSKEYSEKINEITEFLSRASKLINYNIVKSDIKSDWSIIKEQFDLILVSASTDTFFDYMFALNQISELNQKIKPFQSNLFLCYTSFIRKLEDDVEDYKKLIHDSIKYQDESIILLITQLRDVISSIKNDGYFNILKKIVPNLNQNWDASFLDNAKISTLLSLFKDGNSLSAKIKAISYSIDESLAKQKQAENDREYALEKKRQLHADNRKYNSPKYAFRGAIFFGIVGFLTGCVKCSQDLVQVEAHRTDISALLLPIGYTILGYLGGLVVGWIFAQIKG